MLNLTGLQVCMDEEQGRWTAGKKSEVVMRLLRGESIDALSRECETTAEALTKWREDFVAAGTAGLKGKTLEQVRIAVLEEKIGQQAMELEQHETKDRFIRTGVGRSSR